jgi:drug/metabolite transporter (DMT)-like permease
LRPLAVILILLSAFMHAGWNLLARRQRSEAKFFWRMIAPVVVIGLVPAAISELLTHSLTPTAWACVAGSGICCGVYYYCLARGYGSSDFTVVYPVARSLPVLLVAFGDVLRGRYPSTMGWMGMLLVTAGCLLVPLRSLRDLRARHYLNKATLWIVLTALTIVGYTLLDKMASETVQQGPATAARYCYVFFAFSWLVYTVLLRVLGTHEHELSEPVGWRDPMIASVLNYFGYWLVLWAYQLAQQASYILAFRQSSIVIGVVFAFLLYKEQGKVVRLIGTSLITGGLVMIALWPG